VNAVVFLGSHKSGSSYEAIKAADRLGYYTVLLTEKPSFIDKRLEFPHAHSVRLCNLNDLAEVRGALDRLAMENMTICAIVSFVDPYCYTAAVLSLECGLKHFSGAAIEVMLDKVKSREMLAGTPHSFFYRVVEDGVITAREAREMPLVLKSPVSSGSKDVHLTTTAREYQDTFQMLRERYPDVPVLAEKYIGGPQYLLETLTVDGTVHVVAVIEQEIEFTGRFIVTGYQMLIGENKLTRSVKTAAESIVRLHGMRDGPCHLELKRHHGEWKLIEANPRISGGAMNAFIETAYGFDLAEETLKFALGLRPNLEAKYQKESYLHYVIVPERGVLIKVTGKGAAENSLGVKRVYVKSKKGSVLVPALSMGHRYAYVIATGPTGIEARQNAESAAAKITFHLQ
jgi:biotin carboxylase